MDAVRRLLPNVSQDHLRKTVHSLSEEPLPFRKVNYTIPGHDQHTLAETDAWLTTRLEAYGYTVETEGCRVQPFGFDANKPKRHAYAPPPEGTPYYTVHNLYVKKVGTKHPDEIILLVAHKDSQSWIDSPGASDNAVGTAGVLELARVLADYPSERSLWFLFCNEEHTPWTSVTAADNCRQRGDNLIAIFNTDGIGRKSDEDKEAGKMANVTLYTTPEGKVLADLMAEVNQVYDLGLIQTEYKLDRPSNDDGSFIKAGFPHAVCNIGSYPYADPCYHLECDTADRVDIRNAQLSSQAILAAVLHLDQAGQKGASGSQ